MKKITAAIAMAIVFCLGTASVPFAEKPCPWTITKIEVGKWANGKNKSRIWIHGNFPVPPGTSERPTWYVNGRNVGHAAVFFNMRTLPNTSYILKPGENTITVRFLKPPYNGTSFAKTIRDFNWNKVGNGQHKVFQ